jgi:hypothetical protein
LTMDKCGVIMTLSLEGGQQMNKSNKEGVEK